MADDLVWACGDGGDGPLSRRTSERGEKLMEPDLNINKRGRGAEEAQHRDIKVDLRERRRDRRESEIRASE